MSDTPEAAAEAETTQEAPKEESQTEPKEEKKQVPLEALEAERKKRQEAEYQAKWYQEQIARASQAKQEPEQDEDEYTKQIKQEIRQELRQELQNKSEQQFLASHPEAAHAIETKLAPILQQKPHLAYSIQYAENRYEAAMDLIEKYSPKAASESVKKKIEDSSKKPGSPASTGKAGGIGKSEMLDRMKKNRREFSHYRAQLRGRQPNIL